MATTRPRERILAAATRLFADEGIHATSVDRVIAEAGVAPMTVYRHFAGKDELVTATLERWSGEWLGWLRDESGPGDDAGSRLTKSLNLTKSLKESRTWASSFLVWCPLCWH